MSQRYTLLTLGQLTETGQMYLNVEKNRNVVQKLAEREPIMVTDGRPVSSTNLESCQEYICGQLTDIKLEDNPDNPHVATVTGTFTLTGPRSEEYIAYLEKGGRRPSFSMRALIDSPIFDTIRSDKIKWPNIEGEQ